MSQEPAKNFVRQCLGRFCVDVPQSLVRSGDAFQLQYLALEETFWEKPEDDARGRVWEAHLTRITALQTQRELPEHAQGTILEKRAFQSPPMQGVLFHQYDSAQMVTWGALLRRGPVDVWLQIDSDLERADDGVNRLTEVAGAWRPPEAQERLPVRGKDWFYLRHGLVTLPMKYMESAKARFEGHPLGLKIEISTKTVNKVRKQSLIDGLSGAMAAFSGSFSGDEDVVTQKYSSRKVAGLKGEELILRTTDGDEQSLHFLWSYPGEEKSGSRPKFNIEMETSLDQEEAKLVFWNQLLDSVRPAGQ